YTVKVEVLSPSGKYLSMKATHSFLPASSFQVESVGSFRYWVESTSFDASRPAGLSTEPTEFDTLLSRCTGFQPISCAFLIACAANFGVVTLKKTSAPEFFRLTICESTVGSAGSYGSSETIIVFALSPR